MAFFNSFIIRSQFKSRLWSWYKSIKAEKPQPTENFSPAVADGVTKDEFKLRYKNLLINIAVVAFFGAGSLMFMLSQIYHGGIMNGIVFFLLFLVSSLYYLKLSYLSWIARAVYSDWDNRHEPNKKTMRDFVNQVKISPVVLFNVWLKD